MSRHHTIGHPRKWIEPVIVDGEVTEPGYYQAAYQEDVEYSVEEEEARVTEETAAIIAQEAAASVAADKITLETKLKNDTITFEETKDLLRKDRGME